MLLTDDIEAIMKTRKTPCGKYQCIDPDCVPCQEIIADNEAQLKEDLEDVRIERMNNVRDALTQRRQ